MSDLTDVLGVAGRTIVVTGSASGIGRGIAHGLAGLGARVFGLDLEAAESLAERGGSVTDLPSRRLRRGGRARGVRPRRGGGGPDPRRVLQRGHRRHTDPLRGPEPRRVASGADGFYDDPVAVQALADAIPLGRIVEPDELVGTAAYLASRASDYVTGQTIAVDGGFRFL